MVRRRPTCNRLCPSFYRLFQTPACAYPNYEYHVGKPAGCFENPWVLVVFTPSGGINFDQFMYFPLQNYPEHGYGGWLERIDDWAYVHE